jgi:hypothetical protein
MNNDLSTIEKHNGVTYIPYISEKPFTPYTAFYQYLIAERTISKIDCNRLKEFLLSKKDEVLEIKDKLTDGGTGLGLESTTARFRSYNILEWDQEDVQILKEAIFKTHELYFKHTIGQKPPEVCVPSCWMNIMKKGQRIRKHNHGYHYRSYLSGNFTVACEESKTIYVNPFVHYTEKELLERVEDWGDGYTQELYASNNTPGKLTLFPCYIPHFTTKHQADTERITIAFELTPVY